MRFIIPANIGLLAEGLGDFIGPILLFGVYIIASLAKTAAKKRQMNADGEDTEPELKKAVRRRYQEIYQRQAAKTPRQTPPAQQWQQLRRQSEPEPVMPRPRIQEKLRQAAIRERHAQPQSRKNTHKSSPKRIPAEAPAASKQPRSRQNTHQKTAFAEDMPAQPANQLGSLLKKPENLRTAIILKEILDVPLALRDV